MSLEDLNREEARFEKVRDQTADRLRALIDRRLEIIRKDVPDARFTNAMGTSFLYSEAAFQEDSKTDPLYIAYNNVFYDEEPQSEESYGEPLPPHLKEAKMLTEKYSEVIREILLIDEYMEDQLHSVYG